jgi:hypothetical protein
VVTILPHSAPVPELAEGLGYIQLAYNQNFSCPIPPKENRLTVAIRAGEKQFAGALHE